MAAHEEEFKGCDWRTVQSKFFLTELRTNGGRYLYHKAGLKAPPGTVVLFQYTPWNPRTTS